MTRPSRSKGAMRILKRGSLYLTLALMSVVMLLPFYWLVRSSLASNQEVLQPVESFRDLGLRNIHPENYPDVFAAIPFWRYLMNSAFVTGGVVFG